MLFVLVTGASRLLSADMNRKFNMELIDVLRKECVVVGVLGILVADRK